MNYGAGKDILWEYMDRLRWRLRRLPEEHSADILREIRQHMEDLVADYQAEGCAPAEAVRLAEEKFGSAESVANRIQWQRARPAVYALICTFLYGLLNPFSSDQSRLGWSRIAFAAAAGLFYGLCIAFNAESNALNASKRNKMRDNIIGAAIIAIMIALSAYAVWDMVIHKEYDTLIICGVGSSAALTSSLCLKAFRKYWRRVRL